MSLSKSKTEKLPKVARIIVASTVVISYIKAEKNYQINMVSTTFGWRDLVGKELVRTCNQDRKVPGSSPTRRSAGLREPTSLQGSCYLSGRKIEKAVINIR